MTFSHGDNSFDGWWKEDDRKATDIDAIIKCLLIVHAQDVKVSSTFISSGYCLLFERLHNMC